MKLFFVLLRPDILEFAFMKKIFLTAFCIGFLISCNETPKNTISKEEQEEQLADEQFAKIDFSQVDEYPTFQQCLDSVPNDSQKCFEQTLSKLYVESLKKHSFVIGESLTDTLKMYLTIDQTGKLMFDKTEASEKTRTLLPNLDEILATETNGFQQVIPAKKQGVEVSTTCVIPLIIDVK